MSARSQGKSCFRVDGIFDRKQNMDHQKRPNSRAIALHEPASPVRCCGRVRKANIRSFSLVDGLRRRNYHRQVSTAVDREQAEWSIYRNKRCRLFDSALDRRAGLRVNGRWRTVIPGLSFGGLGGLLACVSVARFCACAWRTMCCCHVRPDGRMDWSTVGR